MTLTDLQNGEVNHNFLSSVLKFHHLPDEIIQLTKIFTADIKYLLLPLTLLLHL